MKHTKKSWGNGIESGTPEWDVLHNTPQDCERMRTALISIEVAIFEGANAVDLKAIVQNGLFGRPDPYAAKALPQEGKTGRKCDNCAATFELPATSLHKRFCSEKCRNEWHSMRRKEGLEKLRQHEEALRLAGEDR